MSAFRCSYLQHCPPKVGHQLGKLCAYLQPSADFGCHSNADWRRDEYLPVAVPLLHRRARRTHPASCFTHAVARRQVQQRQRTTHVVLAARLLHRALEPAANRARHCLDTVAHRVSSSRHWFGSTSNDCSLSPDVISGDRVFGTPIWLCPVLILGGGQPYTLCSKAVLNKLFRDTVCMLRLIG